MFDKLQIDIQINYITPSDLGYFSLSINTEAAMYAYYAILKQIFGERDYFQYKALADVIVDVMEIVIDEKAIANVLPGNALFVMHGLKPKKVKYIDYEYDNKTFTSKEIEKTKTELSPDFTVVFETKNEKIFDKIIDLPIKMNKDSSLNYVKVGDYYRLVTGKNELIDTIYFMVKDGKCIITTSLKDVTDPAQNSNAVNDAVKQSILNNNYSVRVDFGRLIKSLAMEVSDKSDRKMIDYLQNNINTMTLESSVKDGSIHTSAIINIKGNHKNSFEYLFNVIENLLEMSEPGKR